MDLHDCTSPPNKFRVIAHALCKYVTAYILLRDLVQVKARPSCTLDLCRFNPCLRILRSSAELLCVDGNFGSGASQICCSHPDKSIEKWCALVLTECKTRRSSAYLSHFLEAHAAFVQEQAEV